MRINFSDLIVPHYCSHCGEIGSILCEYCKYDIISEGFERCLICLGPVGSAQHLCRSCRPPYRRAWCSGERSEALKQLITVYKSHRAKNAHRTCVELLDATLPVLPDDITVVPVPTASSHIRQRGYDHSRLIARGLARKRGLPCRHAIERIGNHRQQGASRKQRLEQAKKAFACNQPLSGRFLLVDDVYTTGATLTYATKSLLDAGANEVWVAVVARQPLDK